MVLAAFLGPRLGVAQERGAIVPATIIAIEGQEVEPGVPITSVNAPFTNGQGKVGFTGAVDRGGSDSFVWFDAGPIWFNSDDGNLSGAEGTMGIGDAAEFIYSPSNSGRDSVWTQDGLLLEEDVAAPGIPGSIISFNSRPTLLPDGTAHWVAGTTDVVGGSTLGRVLYRSTPTEGGIVPVLASGDLVDGIPIDFPSGVDFDYSFSDDGTQHIQGLLLDTGSTADDGAVYVNGVVVARETGTNGDGDNWDNFDTMSINNNGDYLFSGDTDGVTTSDEFIAYNGAIALREGDTVGTFTLTPSASVLALSIDNVGRALHAWSAGGIDVLFFATDASDLIGTSAIILMEGDQIDTDGDDIADYTVTDLNASNILGPGLQLAEGGVAYVEVDVDDGGGELEAILELIIAPTLFSDGFESGDTSAWSLTVG